MNIFSFIRRPSTPALLPLVGEGSICVRFIELFGLHTRLPYIGQIGRTSIEPMCALGQRAAQLIAAS